MLLKIKNPKLTNLQNPLILLIGVSVAFAIRLSLYYLFKIDVSLIIFIIPIILSSLYGGAAYGLSATFASLLLGDFFFKYFIDKPNMFTYKNYIIYAVFFTVGLFINMIGANLKKYEKKRHNLLLLEMQARKNAEQQTRIREHFISVAAHELKSPLTSQKAYLQLIRRSSLHPECDCHRYIPKLEEQVNRIKTFVDDLMDVSKMRTRSLQFKYDFFDINQCLKEAVEQIHDLVITHKIIIKGEIARKAYGDAERIRQVFTNLLSNAIKYSPQANEIIVKLTRSKKEIIICIKDHGIGIEKEYQKKVFNRFFRISGHDESKFKGLGLGLYLCYSIIKKHNGRIWVESVPGLGSEFFFTLPTDQKNYK